MAKADIQTKTSMQTVLSEAKHSVTPGFLCTAGLEAASVYVAGQAGLGRQGLACDPRGPCSQVLSLWEKDL